MSRIYFYGKNAVNSTLSFGYTDDGFATKVVTGTQASYEPSISHAWVQKTDLSMLWSKSYSSSSVMVRSSNGGANVEVIPTTLTSSVNTMSYDGTVNKVLLGTQSDGVFVSHDFGSTLTSVAGTSGRIGRASFVKSNGIGYVTHYTSSGTTPLISIVDTNTNTLLHTIIASDLGQTSVAPDPDRIIFIPNRMSNTDTILLWTYGGIKIIDIVDNTTVTVATGASTSVTGFGNFYGITLLDNNRVLLIKRNHTTNTMEFMYSDNLGATFTTADVSIPDQLYPSGQAVKDASTGKYYWPLYSATGHILIDNNGLSIQYKNASDSYLNGVSALKLRSSYTEYAALSDISLSAYSIPENSVSNSKVADITTTGGQPTILFSLISGEGSVDNSSFSINGDDLIANVALNYEVKSSYSIRIRAIDENNVVFEKPMVLTITDVNETPRNITLSHTSIYNNLAINSWIANIDVIHEDANDALTYTLLGPDAASFNIVNGQLFNAELTNRLLKSQYSITIKITDSSGQYSQESFVLNVEDTANITLSNNAVSESAEIGSVIGLLSLSDPNITNLVFYVDSPLVEVINNNELVLKSNQSLSSELNYEAGSPILNISVNVFGYSGFAQPLVQNLTLNVVNDTSFNDIEEQIILTSSVINETINSSEVEIGTLYYSNSSGQQIMPIPVNGEYGRNISLVSSSEDASHFRLDISTGFYRLMGNSFDYEEKQTYVAKVLIDNTSLQYEKEFQITVIDNLDDNNPELNILDIYFYNVNHNLIEPSGYVAYLFVTGPGSNTVSFSLPNGVLDNHRFQISTDPSTGWRSLEAINIDYEFKRSYQVKVIATNSLNMSYEKVFTIGLNDDPIDNIQILPSGSVQLTMSGQAIAVLSINPTLVSLKTSDGQPLQPGSVIRNSETGQKFFKVAGDEYAYLEIEVDAKQEWNWSPMGDALWSILQGL